MPYYTGDASYYRGDYYQGDPGLFSFVGKALGGVAKLGTSAVRAGLGLQSPGAPPTLSLAAQGFGAPPPQSYGLLNISQPGGSTGLINIGGGKPGLLPAMMRGYHLNKSTYITRGGGTSRWPRSLQVHAKFTIAVRNRRMNVGNARALRRALRRVSGFAKLVKRSKRAISRAASAVGVRRGGRAKGRGGPSVRIVKAA
jgi:hypothetical protein